MSALAVLLPLVLNYLGVSSHPQQVVLACTNSILYEGPLLLLACINSIV